MPASQRVVQICRDARGFKDCESVHRPLTRFRAKRGRSHEDEFVQAEISHRPGNRADIAFVLRLDEDNTDRRHRMAWTIFDVI